MTLSNVTSIVGYLCSPLQNEHTKRAAELNTKIESLEKCLKERKGNVFTQKVSETRDSIQFRKHEHIIDIDPHLTPVLEKAENKVTNAIAWMQIKKEECIKDLSSLNGDYYQDPNSRLKQKWDQVVETAQTALGTKIGKLDQLEEIYPQLQSGTSNQKIAAKTAIDSYRALEKQRDEQQSQLNRIVSLEKTVENYDNNLLDQKRIKLQEKHKELCGDYYGDPKGQLDQAWRRYQTAVLHGSTENYSLERYNQLETNRKQIEAQLFNILQQSSLPVPDPHVYEELTEILINSQISILIAQQKSELNQSGMSLKKCAVTTAMLALTAFASFAL
jgi:hypothetical protein